MKIEFVTGMGSESESHYVEFPAVPREGEYVSVSDDHHGYVRSVSWILGGEDAADGQRVVVTLR